MGKIKQSDLLGSALFELREMSATVNIICTLMSDNIDGICNVDALDTIRVFQMLARKLNDVTDTIEGVHYEIDKEGL